MAIDPVFANYLSNRVRILHSQLAEAERKIEVNGEGYEDHPEFGKYDMFQLDRECQALAAQYRLVSEIYEHYLEICN